MKNYKCEVKKTNKRIPNYFRCFGLHVAYLLISFFYFIILIYYHGKSDTSGLHKCGISQILCASVCFFGGVGFMCIHLWNVNN